MTNQPKTAIGRFLDWISNPITILLAGILAFIGVSAYNGDALMCLGGVIILMLCVLVGYLGSIRSQLILSNQLAKVRNEALVIMLDELVQWRRAQIVPDQERKD